MAQAFLKQRSTLVALAAAVFLAACGGGGGGGGTATSDVGGGNTGTCTGTCVNFVTGTTYTGSGLSSSVVADPVNAKNQVLQLTVSAANAATANVTLLAPASTANGASSIPAAVRGLFSSPKSVVVTPVPTAETVIDTSQAITLRVYSAQAGLTARIVLSDSGTEGAPTAYATATTTGTNTWETLTFTFTEVPSDAMYDTVKFYPTYGMTRSSDLVVLVDEFKYTTKQVTPVDPVPEGNLITNGNFSNGNTGWQSGTTNVPPPEVRTEGGNSYFFANVGEAGQAHFVNLSQPLNVPNANVQYRLTFKASSDRARPITAGIGLFQDPWTNDNETINLTTTTQKFTVLLTSNFAGSNSRVFFDMGQAAGVVVIDDVTLEIVQSQPEPTCSHNITCFSESAPLAVTAFSGAVATIEAGPTGGDGNALKVTRPGGDPWAGAWIALANNIPNNRGNQVVTARVHSPVAGIRMTIKAEYADNQGTGEVDSNETVVAGWQTLTWNLNNLSSANTYNRFVVLPNLGVIGTGQTFYFDNISVADAPSAPASGPSTAAPTPTDSAANVKSIFSGSYTNVDVTNWSVNWSAGATPITDGTAGGDAIKVIDMAADQQEYGAIQFNASKFDASSYTHLKMHYWIDGPILPGQVLTIKLSNHDGAGETNALTYTFTNVTAGSWQTLNIPLSGNDGFSSGSRNNIAEMVIGAPRADLTAPVKVYFDNLYFVRVVPEGASKRRVNR